MLEQDMTFTHILFFSLFQLIKYLFTKSTIETNKYFPLKMICSDLYYLTSEKGWDHNNQFNFPTYCDCLITDTMSLSV